MIKIGIEIEAGKKTMSFHHFPQKKRVWMILVNVAIGICENDKFTPYILTYDKVNVTYGLSVHCQVGSQFTSVVVWKIHIYE